ncbi:hypothetical protein [Sphingomonas sp.]|jgi:hypothetical protein|uniref:hypothetical protein n=1 Tax=Sphingomonas sp. TaxID=28214 RepID=UPI002EDAC5D9
MIMGSPAPAIAAMVMRARRKIAGHFFVHHATSAEAAVAFVPQRPIMRRQFERMQARGIVRDSGNGKYWLDTAAYQADIDRRRRILVPVVIVLVVAAAVAIMLAGYRG